MISLVLADDQPTTRSGLRAIFSKTPDIQIVGEAQDGIEAEKLVDQLRPRILLIDLKMPGLRPAEIENWVRNHCPETVTLVLTARGARQAKSFSPSAIRMCILPKQSLL